MSCEKMENRLHDYADGVLPAAERAEIERHLDTCSDCRSEMEFLNSLRQQVAALPLRFEPPRDLWPEIASRLAPKRNLWQAWLAQLRERKNDAVLQWKNFTAVEDRRFAWGIRGPVAVATLVFVIGGMWFLMQTRQSAWPVARLAGAPQIGAQRLMANGQLQVGEWLETDDSSRAKISVGMIGHVELAPQTRIRLLNTRLTNHRLSLARGKIHAEIWAPPRIFFVETPSALATDLGCEYTLEMSDDGFGRLHVTRGYVALENKAGPESVVPAGAFCEIRPGMRPGTPYSENASDTLRAALAQFDFANGGSETISTVLAEAREADSFTLFHLLFRVVPAERGRVYDRMVEFVSPPPGVTRAGVLQGDKRMLEAWADKFGLGKSWWQYWLPL
jgi:hypothetical protein